MRADFFRHFAGRNEIILHYNIWGTRIYNALKAALFPTKCSTCGAFFHFIGDAAGCFPDPFFDNNTLLLRNKDAVFKMFLAPFLCSACCDRFVPTETPICPKCGFMFRSRTVDDHLCGECLDSPKMFRKARSFGVYDQALMEAIHGFKYNRKIQLARPLGMLLLSALLTYWDEEKIDLVLPVPLHPKRFRERGFNQAFLLIRDWTRTAGALNIDLPFVRIEQHVLSRKVWTEPQTGLGRNKRLKNIKNVFGISDVNKILQKRILLVDDVYTTGSTVNECTKVLLQGGAEQVDVLTLARTV